MRNTKLIDIFGLSGDGSSDDQLDALLVRLELEIPDVPYENSRCSRLPSFITVSPAESGDVLFSH